MFPLQRTGTHLVIEEFDWEVGEGASSTARDGFRPSAHAPGPGPSKGAFVYAGFG
jgi:hypothetical protein